MNCTNCRICKVDPRKRYFCSIICYRNDNSCICLYCNQNLKLPNYGFCEQLCFKKYAEKNKIYEKFKNDPFIRAKIQLTKEIPYIESSLLNVIIFNNYYYPENDWLSNSYQCKIKFKYGDKNIVEFNSVDHIFYFLKKKGKIPNIEEIHKIIFEKYNQNDELKEALIKTKGKVLLDIVKEGFVQCGSILEHIRDNFLSQ